MMDCIATEVEILLAEYPIAQQRFHEKLKVFNDTWLEHWAAKCSELLPLTETPDKSVRDVYEYDPECGWWFPKDESQLPPDPTKWELKDKLSCYYGTLAVLYDQVKGSTAPLRLCESIIDDLLFAWMQRLLANAKTYGKDNLETSLKWVKTDLKQQQNEAELH